MFGFIVDHFISNIPVWVWPFMAGAGFGVYMVAGVAGHFPALKPYAWIVKLLGGVVFVAGVFMFGGAGVTAIWQAQIAEQQAKIAAAVAQSQDANTKLEKLRKQKNKVIVQRQVVIHEQIKTIEKRIDAECKVDPAAVRILNDAAANPETKK
jgi:cell division protein FtsB